MVHTDNNEKKKDKKRGEEEIFPKGNFHFICFFKKREIQKEMTNPDTQGISQSCKK